MHPEFTPIQRARFWAKVEGTDDPDGCWVWIGAKTANGYGALKIAGRTLRAHRVTYEWTHGPIPDDLLVCHNCPGGDRRDCINPAHLWLGNDTENMADRDRKGRNWLNRCDVTGRLLPREYAQPAAHAHANSKKLTSERTAALRFWSLVDKSAECWLWQGKRSPRGYGVFLFAGKQQRAHRVAWQLSIGPIPEGMSLLHRCDVRACVNPDHLFVGTNADNVRDMVAKGRNDRGPNLKKSRGSGGANPAAKLTTTEVESIRARYSAGGVTMQRLADEHGVSRSTVWWIVSGKHWK